MEPTSTNPNPSSENPLTPTPVGPQPNEAAAPAPQPTEAPSPTPTETPAVTPPAEPTPPAPAEPVAPAAPVSAPVAPAAPTPAALTSFTPSATTGGIVVGAVDNAGPVGPAPNMGMPAPKKRFPLPIIGGVAAAVLLLGGAGYYFGVYNSSSSVYSASLKNSGKAITQLTDQLTKDKKTAYKGYVGDGSYSVNSASATTDGKFSFKAEGEKAADLTFDVGLGVTRVSVDTRAIKTASSNTPDVYFKASGIKGLGALTGSSDYDTIVNSLDDKWIVIDHSLVDNLQKQLETQSGTKTTNPTRDQVVDEINAFNKVDQDYVFSSAKDKTVFTIVKNYGKETSDGHKVYHYKVALNKDNVKKYITAQHDALKASKLNDWIKANNYTDAVDSSYKDLLKSSDDIKTSDTFDIYSDISNRIIYKVRFSNTKNPATNYVDLGLNYKKGDTLPFFLNGNFDDSGQGGKFALKATWNTKSDQVDFSLTANGTGDDKTKATATATFKPTNDALNITAPTGAISIMQVLQQLGLSDYLDYYLTGAASTGSSLTGAESLKATTSTTPTGVNQLRAVLGATGILGGN